MLGLLDELDASADALHSIVPACIDGEQLISTMFDFQRTQARIDAAHVRLAGEYDARGDWRRDRAKSAASWLAHKTRSSNSECAVLILLARKLRSMPNTEAAFARGDITKAHVQLLAKANRPAVAELFARDEAGLIQEAARLSFEGFTKAIKTWEQCADPDGSEERVRPGTLQIAETMGGHDIRGFLPGTEGAEVAEALRRAASDLFGEDWNEAKTRFEAEGRDPQSVTKLDLGRSDGERNAAALVRVCRQAFAAPAEGKQPRPLVTVVVDQRTAVGRVCEILGGCTITPGQVASALLEGDIAKLILNLPTRPIEASTARFFTGMMRRAIEVRSGCCDVPGCDTPANHCEVDHIDAHCDGGETSTCNGCCLCTFHHRLKTKGQLILIRGPDGDLHFFAPDGHEIT